MKLGIMIEGQEGLTWPHWQRIAGRVEELGFESLWRSDHFLSTIDDPSRSSLETWPSLTYLAQATRRLRFGPLVSPITFRHPSLLGRMAAAVDDLSDGRLQLGMGAGWHETEHRAYGLPFPPAGERISMLEEGIQVVRTLWGAGPASFQGRHYRLEGVDARPKPAQRPGPPIVVGGKDRRVLGVVARRADEWNFFGLTLDGYAEHRATLEALCREAGRDPGSIRHSRMGGYLVGRDDRDLEQRARRLQQVIPHLGQQETTAVPGLLRERGWLVGTPDEIADQVGAWSRAGVHRLMLQHLDLEDDEALELPGTEAATRVTA